jgi:thiol-disulfide isomerase/thioredoxin
LAAYVRFRQLSADYTLSLQEEHADLAKIGEIQENWTVQLQGFVEAYPKSGDATEAMFQLAIAEEFAGDDKEAIAWYDKVVQRGAAGLSGRKAKGAKTRLESVGKPISLRGPGVDGRPIDLSKYRGRLTLLQYWATWCEPCKADLKSLAQLYAKYHARGFEIVGISLDNNSAQLVAFLKANRLPWPTIFEKGGLDSRPALELGVMTLPTMLLVDEKGNVLNRNVSVPEVAAELEKRLPDKSGQ